MADSGTQAETGRSRVLAAIDHVQPEIVPFNVIGFDPVEPWLSRFGAADAFDLRYKLGLDVQSARAVYDPPVHRPATDIWGKPTNVMGALGAGYGSTRGEYPLAGATTIAAVRRFDWPDPDDFDYSAAATALRDVPAGMARLVHMVYAVRSPERTPEQAARSSFSWMPLLCSLFDLLGMERTLAWLYEAPELIQAMIERLEEFLLGFERRLLEATRGVADIFGFDDDFASQQGMLLSPKHWRQYLAPTYGRIYALAQSFGLKIWVHSCGTFREVLPDMIDMGMNVWEAVQVHLRGNDPTEIKREFGRDISFFGGISTQTSLRYGSPAEVRRDVQERISVLGRGGGYICGPDHTVLADVPPENLLALASAVREFVF
jgi:uroporphyrinogen decarboxylase